MCSAKTGPLSWFTSNEATSKKAAAKTTSAGLNGFTVGEWSRWHMLAGLCLAYLLVDTLTAEEGSGCLFECCVVLAAVCVHFFFQALEKRPSGKPAHQREVKETNAQAFAQCKQQEALVQAVGRMYQDGSDRLTVQKELESRFAGCPVTPEITRIIVDTCIGAHDAQGAVAWLRFSHTAGCRPTSGLLVSVLRALLASSEAAAAEDLLKEFVVVAASDSACCQILFEHCISCLDVPRVEAWLERLASEGNQAQLLGYAGLMRACVKCGADQAEHWMRHALAAGVTPSLQMYNALLFVCGRLGDVQRAESWFRSLSQGSVGPDTASYAGVMDACARHGNHARAQSWFERMVSSGMKGDVFTHHTLIKAYARAGDAFGAEKCMLRAKDQGLQLQAFGYNAVIAAAAKSGQPDMAQRWLHRLLADGIEPDAMSFNCVIDAWAKSGDACRAQAVLELMTSGPVKPDVITIGMVLHACAKAGEARRAEQLFRQVVNDKEIIPDAICYNAMIHAFVQTGNISRAEFWLMAMLEHGISASVVSYTTVIHAHARQGSIAQAEAVLQRMLERGVEANVVTFSALIQACSKTGDIERAEKWFDVMRESGIKANDMSYSTMLNVFAKAGDSARAEKWLQNMEHDGVPPNTVCYNNVIEACTKAGRLDRAESWLQALTTHSELKPTRKSYTIAAQGFSKIGRWQDAERIMKRMESDGIRMDEFSLTVLLSAYNRARPTQSQRGEEAFVAYAREGLRVTAPPVRVLRNLLGTQRVERLLQQEKAVVVPE